MSLCVSPHSLPQPSVTSLASASSLHRFIATLDQLKDAIGSPTTSTVLRKLRELGYLSSYSHRGGYYTLLTVPQFDEQGLWQHLSAGFSK